MTQSQMVLRHLEDYGSITQMDAIRDYGIMRLASRVNDLRKAGHPIISERVDGENKFGEKCHWARYRMGARA